MSAAHAGSMSWTPVTDPAHWLRLTGGTRACRPCEVGVDLDSSTAPMIVTPLGGKLTKPGAAVDRACDHCRRYRPPTEEFHPLAHSPAPGHMLIGGLCRTCARAEGTAE